MEKLLNMAHGRVTSLAADLDNNAETVGYFSGLVSKEVVGEAVSMFNTLYFDSATGKFAKTSYINPGIVQCMALKAGAKDDVIPVLWFGLIRNRGWAFTPGAVTINDNAGGVGQNIAAAASAGTALTPTDLFFAPQPVINGGYPVFQDITAYGITLTGSIDSVLSTTQFSVSNHLFSLAPVVGVLAEFQTKVYRGSAIITAAESIVVDLSHNGIGTVIPANEKIVGAYLHVKTALADGETWIAKFDDGAAVLTIATDAAVAQNTNVALVDVTGVKTDADTNILITKTGGGAFTAQGEIEVIVITEGWLDWVDEPAE